MTTLKRARERRTPARDTLAPPSSMPLEKRQAGREGAVIRLSVSIPAISWAVLSMLPLWSAVGFFTAGLLGLGIAFTVIGACEIGIAVLSVKSRPPTFRSLKEERIGAFDKRGRLRLSRAELRRRAA